MMVLVQCSSRVLNTKRTLVPMLRAYKAATRLILPQRVQSTSYLVKRTRMKNLQTWLLLWVAGTLVIFRKLDCCYCQSCLVTQSQKHQCRWIYPLTLLARGSSNQKARSSHQTCISNEIMSYSIFFRSFRTALLD